MRGVVTAVLFAGFGIYSIVSGVMELRRMDLAFGVVFVFLAPGMYVARLQPQAGERGYRRLRRWATASSVFGVALAVAGGLAWWFGIDTTVAPPTLIDHPLVYNDRHVQTFGHILAGGGQCTLVVKPRHARPSAADAHAHATIWLSAASPLCAASTTRDIRADVSGNFYVLEPTEHFPGGYVLAGADITHVGNWRTGGGT